METSLDRRLLELAITVVAAHWKADFEWWAHAQMAREHGVDDTVVAAIGCGKTPLFEADDEAAVYNSARQFVVGGGVDGATFASAVEWLGRQGVVEPVSQRDYYTLVSFTLNPSPYRSRPGVALTWP